MRQLKILMVLPDPPLPFGNAAARWYYAALKELVARGHKVKVLATQYAPEQAAQAAALFPASHYDLQLFEPDAQRLWHQKWKGIIQPYAYILGSKLRAAFVSSLQQSPDIVHLEHQWCAYLPDWPRERTLLNIHYLQTIDLRGTPATTFKEQLLNLAVRHVEPRLLRRAHYIRTLSKELAQVARSLAPKTEASIVPLAMDLSLYDYTPDALRPTAPIISLIGTMNWYPTYSAAIRLLLKIWPKIKAAVPDASLQIIGWNARARLDAHIGPQWRDSIVVHENVPDIRPFFKSSAVLVYAPTQGSGMKVKILEAMAYGLPCVTTPDGVEGLPVQNGCEAIVAEQDDELAAGAIQLLRDTNRQNSQRFAARKMLERHCDPKQAVTALEAIYEMMILRSNPALASK